jgi:hypothetical protein
MRYVLKRFMISANLKVSYSAPQISQYGTMNYMYQVNSDSIMAVYLSHKKTCTEYTLRVQEVTNSEYRIFPSLHHSFSQYGTMHNMYQIESDKITTVSVCLSHKYECAIMCSIGLLSQGIS